MSARLILSPLIKSIFSILSLPVLPCLVIIGRGRIVQYVVVFLVPFHRFVPLENFVLGAERYALRPVSRVVAISEAFLLVLTPAGTSLLVEKIFKIVFSLALFPFPFEAEFNF